MKHFLLTALLIFSTNAFSSIEETCKSTLIYFDLGNTLVNTKDHPYEVRYMPEALEYLNSLKEAGCTMSLIVNIPESFGETYQKKIATLKEYVNSRWMEEAPFVWDYFKEIYVPHSNGDLKPKPILFRQVHLNAWMLSKKVFYQGETPAEIEAAKKAGMNAFLVGSRGNGFFLPIDEIK